MEPDKILLHHALKQCHYKEGIGFIKLNSFHIIHDFIHVIIQTEMKERICTWQNDKN